MPNKTVREFLDCMRIEHGLSFREITRRAGAAGFHLAAATLWEMCRRENPNPSVETIKALAAGTGVSTAEVGALFGIGEQPVSVQTWAETVTNVLGTSSEPRYAYPTLRVLRKDARARATAYRLQRGESKD